jgi:hypothetical protein
MTRSSCLVQSGDISRRHTQRRTALRRCGTERGRKGSQRIETEILSPLKHQRHADWPGRGFREMPTGICSGYHLHCSQTFSKSHYASIALFKGLAGKFRLLFDLNLVLRYHHGHHCYAFNFKEPENRMSNYSLCYTTKISHRLPRQALAPAKRARVRTRVSRRSKAYLD